MVTTQRVIMIRGLFYSTRGLISDELSFVFFRFLFWRVRFLFFGSFDLHFYF